VRQYEEALAQNALGEPMEVFMASALAQREELDRQLDVLSRRVEQLDAEVSNAEADSGEKETRPCRTPPASGAAPKRSKRPPYLLLTLKIWSSNTRHFI